MLRDEKNIASLGPVTMSDNGLVWSTPQSLRRSGKDATELVIHCTKSGEVTSGLLELRIGNAEFLPQRNVSASAVHIALTEASSETHIRTLAADTHFNLRAVNWDGAGSVAVSVSLIGRI